MRIALIFSLAVWLILFYIGFSYNSNSMNDCTKSHDIATCYEAYK